MSDFNQSYLSINQVSIIIDSSVTTIKRWYKWYEDDNFDKPLDLVLPKYYYLDGRKTKYFHRNDIVILQKFKECLNTCHKGIMAEYNAEYQWGNRGKEIIKRKEEQKVEQNAN